MLPEALRYLWNIFIKLARSRPIAEGGFLPIPWRDIDSWSRLYGVRLNPWELDALSHIDDLWLQVMAKKHVSFEDLKGDDTDA